LGHPGGRPNAKRGRKKNGRMQWKSLHDARELGIRRQVRCYTQSIKKGVSNLSRRGVHKKK